MSDTPSYPQAQLHQVTRRITDGSHFSPTPREFGHLIANVKDMKSGEIDFNTCTRISEAAYRELKATGCTIKNGNVLLSKDGTVGRVVVYKQDDEIGALSSICIIEPTDQLDAAFLGQALQSEGCARQYDNFMSGSALRRLVLRDIRSIKVPLPEPEHQRPIAKVLDTLDTAIHETEAIIVKLKAVKQGLLHDLLTRGIDANGELRPPQAEAPHLYNESPVGWVPKAWEVKTVSEVAEVKSGATPSREQANRYFGLLGIPWVKTLDLNEDLIRATDECVTATALRETSCSLLPEGTVLVAMYGGWEQIGRTALLAVPAATNQAISSLLMRSSSTVPEFVLRALQHGRPRWHRVAASTRKDPNITKADVLAFAIPMPTPDEQTEIARRLRTCLDRLELESSTLAKLRHQKSGLMDDLLTGRVRVTPVLAEAAQQQGSA